MRKQRMPAERVLKTGDTGKRRPGLKAVHSVLVGVWGGMIAAGAGLLVLSAVSWMRSGKRRHSAHP